MPEVKEKLRINWLQKAKCGPYHCVFLLFCSMCHCSRLSRSYPPCCCTSVNSVCFNRAELTHINSAKFVLGHNWQPCTDKNNGSPLRQIGHQPLEDFAINLNINTRGLQNKHTTSVNVTNSKCPMWTTSHSHVQFDKGLASIIWAWGIRCNQDYGIFKVSYSLQCLIDHLLSLTSVVWGDFIFRTLTEVI